MGKLDAASILEDVKNDDFFKHFSQEDLELFAENAHERTYPRGQILFTERDPYDLTYYILSGFVRLERGDVNGVNTFYCYARERTAFPYVNFFHKSICRYRATAITDVKVLYISKDIIEGICSENPNMLMSIIKDLQDITLIREERLQYMLQQNARMRVVASISYLMKELGRMEGDVSVITCPISVKEIAEIAGTSRETASSVIGKLREREIIEIRGKRHFQVNAPQFFDPLPEINQIFFC